MAEKVRDIMARDLRACPTDAPIAEAAKTMRAEDIGDVIVLGDDGTLRGVLTDRDIAVRAVAEGRDPSQLKADDICSHDVTTVSPDTDAEEAARIMREQSIRRLPVVEDGKPVGVVSIGDLAIERDPRSALADISAAPGNR